MNTFTELLKDWEAKATKEHEQVEISVTLHRSDLVKIKAFAEAYGLDESTVTATLLHVSIKEAEQAMPYVKGSQVIRVEEGEEVFADAGKTPAYVEAEQKIAKQLTNRD